MHMLLYYLMSVKILSLISAERLTRRFFIVRAYDKSIIPAFDQKAEGNLISLASAMREMLI